MPLFVAKGLGKAFGEAVLFANVDVSVHQGERVGIVGNNGSGKSTFARIVAGLEPADEGEIAFRKGVRCRYLEQEPQFDETQTGRAVVLEGLGAWVAATDKHRALSEQIALQEAGWQALLEEQQLAEVEVEHLGGWEQGHKVESILERLGLSDIDRVVGQMSGGERRRVALAQLLVEEPELAILDEPTNHLDPQTIDWLETYLDRQYPGALMIITHDRYVLDRVAKRTLEIEGGQVHQYAGGWQRYLREKSERAALAARTESNRKNLLRTELDWLSRSPKARSTKQKARAQRAEELRDRPSALIDDRNAQLQIQSARLGSTVLEARDLRLVAPDGKPLIDKWTFILSQGQRVGIIGSNGSGKTTLLRALMGEFQPAGGRVRVGSTVSFAYFDQGRTGLVDDATIQQNVAGDTEKIQFAGRTMDIRSYLQRFLFARKRLNDKVGVLSGGERARVALAKMLLVPANVLVLDEPTNDLDVATLGSLEAMIVEANTTALMVSHDRYFLDKVANTILSFENDRQIVEYAGDYSAFVSLKTNKEPNVAKQRRASRPKPARTGLTFKEKKELATIEKRIDKTEKETQSIEQQLADPSLYAERPLEVAALVDQRSALKEETARLMLRWEELAARVSTS